MVFSLSIGALDKSKGSGEDTLYKASIWISFSLDHDHIIIQIRWMRNTSIVKERGAFLADYGVNPSWEETSCLQPVFPSVFTS